MCIENFVSLYFFAKNRQKICDASIGQIFSLGVRMFRVNLCFQMIQNIQYYWSSLSVQTGFISKMLRFIENFVSLSFLSKIPQNLWCQQGLNFRFGVKQFSVNLCYKKIQNRLLQTFDQWDWGYYNSKSLKFIGIFWVWVFCQKFPKTWILGQKFSDGFKDPNDTERTTADGLPVDPG